MLLLRKNVKKSQFYPLCYILKFSKKKNHTLVHCVLSWLLLLNTLLIAPNGFYDPDDAIVVEDLMGIIKDEAGLDGSRMWGSKSHTYVLTPWGEVALSKS